MAVSEANNSQQHELERLRARIAELERELVEQTAVTNRIVADAQERTYWLDRWHVDLNALMRRPGAAELRAAVRAVRYVMRGLAKVKRKLTQAS